MKIFARELGLLALLLCVAMLLSSCGGYTPDGGSRFNKDKRAALHNSVAVLGVVSREASLRDFRRKILANELEAQIRVQQPDVTLLPFNQLELALNAEGVHQMLLSRYRMNGELTSEDWQLIRSTGLKVRYLLVARVESNTTAKFEPARSSVRNSRGEVLSDRLEVALMHQRVVEISAQTYEVQTGRVVWSETYASKPVNKRVYTEYTGSSFTGSVATLLANSFVNGKLSTKYPPAPSSSEAIKEAFKRVAQKMLGDS